MKTAAPSRGAAAGGYSEKPQNKHRIRSAQAAQHHLTAEWLSLRDATRHDLECLGITREAMYRAGGLAKARITTIGRLCRFEGEIHFDATKPDGQMVKVFDVTRMRARGLTTPTGLEAGLARTVIWFARNYATRGEGLRL